MLTGIDISNWQRGFNVTVTKPGFVILKATEGTNFTDKSCDGFVQQAIKAGIPFGFYHFANGSNNAAQQARFFRNQTKGYERKGIPILDFEYAYSNSWIDEFVKEYHAITGVFPWVYMNSDYVNNKGYGSDYVKKNCGLWLAGYPSRMTTYPAGKECPYKHPGWTLAAWQFTDNLSIGGMNVDGDIFYGDASAWNKYANPGGSTGGAVSGGSAPSGDKWRLARQVINGVFGDGDTRKTKLGSRYSEVQECVNALINESDSRLATRVIAGQLGNGDDRKYILGGRYTAVQKQVNKSLR